MLSRRRQTGVREHEGVMGGRFDHNTYMKSHREGCYCAYLIYASSKHKWKEISPFDKTTERRGWSISDVNDVFDFFISENTRRLG